VDCNNEFINRAIQNYNLKWILTNYTPNYFHNWPPWLLCKSEKKRKNLGESLGFGQGNHPNHLALERVGRFQVSGRHL
jgi:hypothetical protein